MNKEKSIVARWSIPDVLATPEWTYSSRRRSSSAPRQPPASRTCSATPEWTFSSWRRSLSSSRRPAASSQCLIADADTSKFWISLYKAYGNIWRIIYVYMSKIGEKDKFSMKFAIWGGIHRMFLQFFYNFSTIFLRLFPARIYRLFRAKS
jgi:hypothetical protein